MATPNHNHWANKQTPNDSIQSDGIVPIADVVADGLNAARVLGRIAADQHEASHVIVLLQIQQLAAAATLTERHLSSDDAQGWFLVSPLSVARLKTMKLDQMLI